MKTYPFIVLGLMATSGIAAAQDGTITFDGNVTAQTCVVEPISNGPRDGNNFVVNLPGISAHSLKMPGMRGANIPFHIVVGSGSQPCLEGSVRGMFRNVGDNNPAGRLSNRGTASNVDVVVLNELHVDVDLNSSANSLRVPIDPAIGVGVLSWYSSYHATAAAGPGTVTARVEYVLDYQ